MTQTKQNYFLSQPHQPFFILGIVNFSVAILLLIILWKEIHKKIRTSLISLSVFIFIILIFGIFVTKPITLHGEQKRYKDKIILSEQSKYQKIVITEWRNEHWLYINNKQQLCTIDEAMYHEPLVHPAAKLSGVIKNVLIFSKVFYTEDLRIINIWNEELLQGFYKLLKLISFLI